VLLPDGPKIAFAGGLDFNDHKLIWDTLDDIHSRPISIACSRAGGWSVRRDATSK